jgi:hypothetical protein
MLPVVLLNGMKYVSKYACIYICMRGMYLLVEKSSVMCFCVFMCVCVCVCVCVCEREREREREKVSII